MMWQQYWRQQQLKDQVRPTHTDTRTHTLAVHRQTCKGPLQHTRQAIEDKRPRFIAWAGSQNMIFNCKYLYVMWSASDGEPCPPRQQATQQGETSWYPRLPITA